MPRPLSDRIAKAKEIDIVSYLSSIGHDPKMETGSLVIYYSPLRGEKVASFCVSKKTGKWADHGNRSHGDILDLVMQMEKVDLPRALDILLGGEARPVKQFRPLPNIVPGIEIIGRRAIISPELIVYLGQRKISPVVAKKHLSEVDIRFPFGMHPDKTYTLLGWQNDSGGLELRNAFFKVSNSPKNITTIKGLDSGVLLFEGWPDYLTYLTKYGESRLSVIVLNSLSFLPSVLPMLRGKVIHSYLDNDTAGDEHMAMLKDDGFDVRNCRIGYLGYKDLNDKHKDGKFGEVPGRRQGAVRH